MAKTDFYPSTDGGKLAFLTNFVTQLPSVTTVLQIAAADITAITAAKTNLANAQAHKAEIKALAQAAVAGTAAVDKATEETIRAQVRRIKTHPAYIEAMGKQLGIEVGGGATMAAATVGGGPRPNLEATSILNGAVEVTFLKNGYTGVEIECQRGTETTYSFLARDTEAPYVDTRASLTDGPETRHYRARYLKKDTLAADFSDVLVVTVPGKA